MNINDKVMNGGKTAMAAGALLLLTACHQEFTLLDANNGIVGNGTVEATNSFPAPVHVTVNGKTFSGSWDVSKVYEEDMAKMHRLINTRSYEEYMRGDSPHQLWRGYAKLKAEDGTQMECESYYRSHAEMGECTIEGNTLTIKFAK